MATTCDACGHKTNEVKSGSGIEPYGVRFILKIETEEDLSRDVLKVFKLPDENCKVFCNSIQSDTCAISIKELELEVGAAAFGSRYTTVEGILSTIKDELKLSNPLATGDSGDPLLKEKMESFLTKLDEIISGKWKVTLILDDPCGNSYVQSIHYPNPDTNLTVEKYKRSREQDEELGLLDMKVENYEES
ncbi:zinc finger protein ZPR1-like [Stegodyphus dumicola]|uniref:zinc finger protein ZPR1-like n=1 Tax=Stegodyphus dumicola TaxID=202533 RepID=UPI0015B16E7B|nr:zinc finger protein ZPR1-like [Stegodyphus dumicola]